MNASRQQQQWFHPPKNTAQSLRHDATANTNRDTILFTHRRCWQRRTLAGRDSSSPLVFRQFVSDSVTERELRRVR